MYKKYLLIVAFVVVWNFVSGQIDIRSANNSDLTPKSLIYDVFLGKGVEIISVKYDGVPYSVGYFSNGTQAVGLNNGIIMTTGKSLKAKEPNNQEDNQSGSSDSQYSDAELSAAINNNTLIDICRYEIEFIPYTDSLTFRYVFASEEYPEYSCSEFNDAFGFFITGPNPQGGMYQSENLAIIPGTNIPVSVENIHPAFESKDCKESNAQYYNANPIGSNTMTYDGYLDVFTVSAKVVPCNTYKIKMVIADVGDELYDSAVFLDSKSFSTDVVDAEIITPSLDRTISEGCSKAVIKFSFENNINEDFDVGVRVIDDNSLGNMATKDIDYELSTNSGIIAAGTNALQFDIVALEDNIVEQKELVAIEYQRDFCNLDTLYLEIIENQLTLVDLPDKLKICEGNSKNVGAKFPADYEFPDSKYYKNNALYSVGNNKGSYVVSKININGIYPTLLEEELIKEVCIDTFVTRVLDNIQFHLISPDLDTLELSTNNGYRPNGNSDVDSMINTCFNRLATTNINNGNSEQGDYFPANKNYTGKYKPEGQWNRLYGGATNGNWQLKITNENAGYSSSLKGWRIAFKNNYNIDYNWSPNSNISCTDCLSPDISPTDSTDYFLHITDNYGCEAADTISVEVNKKEAIKDLSCDSISTDFIRFNWSVNNADEKYEIWNSKENVWKETAQNFYNVSSLGFVESVTFKVRIKDTECPNIETETTCTTYPCPPPQIKVLSKTDVSCFGVKDGTVSLSASGTLAPYNYRFGSVNNQTGYFDNLPAGDNIIYITDADSCEIPFHVNISGPDSISLAYEIKDISCFGNNDGNITLNVEGGNGGYTYSWTNNYNSTTLTSKNISSLRPGTYYLEVADVRSCTKKDSVVITEPELLQIKDSLIHIECKGTNTGKINIEVLGGTKEYSFDWDTPIGKFDTQNLINVPAGVYKLTVTDKNGCSTEDIFVLNEPEEGLEIAYTLVDSMCYGENKGSISLDIANPDKYTINWSTGDSGVTEINNLGPGLYEVTITSEDGCQKVYSKNIVRLDTIDLIFDLQPPTCYNYDDGKAGIVGVLYGKRSGNIDDFTFEWNTTPLQTGRFAYNLKGGNVYTVKGVNKIGCRIEESIEIENPDALEIILKSKKDVSCYGESDGSIYLDKNGGNDNCTFQWSENANTDNQSFATGLKSDVYKVTLTDDKGCIDRKAYSIFQPSPIRVSFNYNDVKCHNGSDGRAVAIVSGGTEPYNYSWENTLENMSAIDGLKSGNYTITVTDFNECKLIDSVHISQPEEGISTTVETVDATCFGGYDGEILITSYGGNPPYLNKVDGGKFYGNGVLIGISSGEYTVVVKDINGCMDTVENVFVGQADKISLNIGEDEVVKYGNSLNVEANVANATEPISYHWLVPEGVAISCDTCEQTQIEVYHDLLVNLEIVDSNGCIAEVSKNIFVKLDKGIFVPTAINPESMTHANSKLFVYGKDGTKILSFSVYDKWGAEIYNRRDFAINDEEEGWNGTFEGKKLEQGVYAWKLEVENVDGTKQTFKGYVTLLR